MIQTTIRNMTFDDASDVLALNEAVVRVTSPMNEDRFQALHAISECKMVAQVNGKVAAFVMAIACDREYANGNYEWFAKRLKRFLYIDRVVVSDVCRGMGVGRQLYAKTYDWAKQAQLLTICAEMNIDPPNQNSLRFHEQAGFVQIGPRLLENGNRVSMQIRRAEDDCHKI